MKTRAAPRPQRCTHREPPPPATATTTRPRPRARRPQALSDAQQLLFEERERLLSLQAENDELRLQELGDRQRMQQLLAASRPLEQSVALRGDGGLPAVVAVPHGGGGGGWPGREQQQQQQRA